MHCLFHRTVWIIYIDNKHYNTDDTCQNIKITEISNPGFRIIISKTIAASNTLKEEGCSKQRGKYTKCWYKAFYESLPPQCFLLLNYASSGLQQTPFCNNAHDKMKKLFLKTKNTHFAAYSNILHNVILHVCCQSCFQIRVII